jgi:hypothetical protein
MMQIALLAPLRFPTDAEMVEIVTCLRLIGDDEHLRALLIEELKYVLERILRRACPPTDNLELLGLEV